MPHLTPLAPGAGTSNHWAAADADGTGEICVGAAGGGCDGFGGGFLAAAMGGFSDAGAPALAGGEATVPPAGVAPATAALPVPGSGDMMLTAGVDAADGNSALVGFPVGADGG